MDLYINTRIVLNKIMAPKLYARIRSPPCRAVLMVAKTLGVELEFINVNIGDNLKPEYIKINPQHTVPTLEDDGKIIWDSHAINVYLVTKYGKDDSLYPTDPYKRAVVDQRFHFDTGVLFAVSKQIKNCIVEKKLKTIPIELINAMEEAYGFLEKFLEGHQWVAGDDLTLADFSLIALVTSTDLFAVPIDKKKFPNIIAWIKRAEAWPCYDINLKGLEEVKKGFVQTNK